MGHQIPSHFLPPAILPVIQSKMPHFTDMYSEYKYELVPQTTQSRKWPYTGRLRNQHKTYYPNIKYDKTNPIFRRSSFLCRPQPAVGSINISTAPKKKMLNMTKRTQFSAFSGQFPRWLPVKMDSRFRGNDN